MSCPLVVGNVVLAVEALCYIPDVRPVHHLYLKFSHWAVIFVSGSDKGQRTQVFHPHFIATPVAQFRPLFVALITQAQSRIGRNPVEV
jgi:hypothetical protein